MAIFQPIKYKDLIYFEGIDKETGEKTERFEEREVTVDLKTFLKTELPTIRFWLMLSMKRPERFDDRYKRYKKDLEEFLKERFISDDNKEKLAQIGKTIAKLEASAWRTCPPEFLKQMRVPRVTRI